jgi:hypothetical protein
VQVFEAERSLTATAGGIVTRGTGYSRQFAVQGGDVTVDLMVPRGGRYWVMVSGQAAGSSLSYGNGRHALERVDLPDGMTPQAWWATAPIEVGPRTQRLRFAASSPMTIDQIVLVQATPGRTLQQALASDAPEIQWVKESPTRYRIEIATAAPVLLTLGQRFHGQWEGQAGDSNVLTHIPSGVWGWQNAFRVAPGTSEVDITFAEQRSRDVVLSLWFAVWGVGCAMFAVLGIAAWRRRHASAAAGHES